jgi:DNA-binding transcriptional ArsR family regulator
MKYVWLKSGKNMKSALRNQDKNTDSDSNAVEKTGKKETGADLNDQRLAAIESRLDELLACVATSTSAIALSNSSTSAHESGLIRNTRAPLPDPRLVRRLIRQRDLRNKFFSQDLFADPAWNMLLDLTAARAEHRRVSVTSLCIASGVPATTALRWITVLVEAKLVDRIEDDTDRRRAFIALSDRGADIMSRYFLEVSKLTATP